jgi:phosphatidylinositol kinase/protein kinase (PI-3  family)
VEVNDMIQVIAEKIKSLPKNLRSKTAADELKRVSKNFPPKFQLCLSPRVECKGLKADKCKVMSSKKMPVWLVFDNADPNGEPYIAIFKAGDDLRQDLMTLQLLRIMDHFWTKNGLDLRLNPYGCCATGHDLGMIEVVKNSDTTARIQVAYGGKNMGAWKDTPIDMFLREKNKDSQYLQAVQNFVHTCAGYCVATYVLGIGDRHADNIMITNSGHLFHIDFGHFLGNFKSKFGYKRERAPFVFTPEMAYVMGNRDNTFGFPDRLMSDKEPKIGFPEFEQLCCQAYNVLREHSNLLMNLFILVVPAAMPELLDKTDVTYLKDMLSCEMTNEQADKKFKEEIKKSLRTVSRRFDNWIHNMKHG